MSMCRCGGYIFGHTKSMGLTGWAPADIPRLRLSITKGAEGALLALNIDISTVILIVSRLLLILHTRSTCTDMNDSFVPAFVPIHVPDAHVGGFWVW